MLLCYYEVGCDSKHNYLFLHVPFKRLTSKRQALSCYPHEGFGKGERECWSICLHPKIQFYKARKNTFLHTKAQQGLSSVLGVDMEISYPGCCAQQYRVLCAPETQPLIYCRKRRGQPSCQLWKTRMSTFKLLSQTLLFFYVFLLETQQLAAWRIHPTLLRTQGLTSPSLLPLPDRPSFTRKGNNCN